MYYQNIIQNLPPLPEKFDFTVYIKSGCSYCIQVKNLLTMMNLKTRYINIDAYIITPQSKENFFNFIEELTGKKYRTFPIVFFDGDFIGGYNETKWFVSN